MACGHPDLQKDTHSRRHWTKEDHNSATSLNLTTDDLEHVTLMAITLGYYSLSLSKNNHAYENREAGQFLQIIYTCAINR